MVQKRRKNEEEKKRWTVSRALKSNVTLKDFGTIQYISKPIPDPIFSEILNLWKRKDEPDNRLKNDIYNDDAYYIDNCGSHNFDSDIEVWQRREESYPRREQSSYIKETVLQSKWGEKKERPLPNIPKMMYLSENLYNLPEGDEKSSTSSATYLKQKVIDYFYIDSDGNMYEEPPLPLTKTTIPPQLPPTTIHESKPSSNLCELRDIQPQPRRRRPPPPQPPPPPQTRADNAFMMYEDGNEWRSPPPPPLLGRPRESRLPLPLESPPTPIILKSNTEEYYLYDDARQPPPPPPIGNDTRKTEQSKHKQGPSRSTFMKRLKLPILTWTEPQAPSINSEPDSRVSSDSSGFIHIGCEAACSCHTAPKTLPQDSSSTSTSSGFIQVAIGVDDVYGTPSEQDVLHACIEYEDTPPPIPPRVPLSTVPLDGPEKDTEEENETTFECSEQLKASLKGNQRKLEIIKTIKNDRSPHSHSKKADGNLTLEPDTDDGYEEIDNDNGEAGPSRTDESVLTKHSNDDGILPSSHGVDTTSLPQFTSGDISNKGSEILSGASVSKTSSRVLIKESNEEGVNDTIEDQLNCEYHYNTVPKEKVVEQRGICGNTEQNNKTLTMTEKSNGMHDEVRQLQIKRRAIEERNTVDKAKIDEKTKINTELKQSVDYKRKLALLDKEESSLESEIQAILKLGLGDSFEERQWPAYDTRSIEEQTDTLYFARIARRNSSRLGFRRGRSGAPFTRLGRQSVISQSTYTADSGLGQGTYY